MYIIPAKELKSGGFTYCHAAKEIVVVLWT